METYMSTTRATSTRTAPAIALIAIATLSAAPVLLSATPASASTSLRSHSQISSGEYRGSGSFSTPRATVKRMDIDDAYVSAGRHGNLDVLLGGSGTYVEASIRYAGGRVIGGHLQATGENTAVKGGSINRGKGLEKQSHIVLRTTTGTMTLNLNLR